MYGTNRLDRAHVTNSGPAASAPDLRTLTGAGARLIVLALWMISIPLSAIAQNPGAATGPIDLGVYAMILSKHTREVSDAVGVRVDYKSIKKDPHWRSLVQQVSRAKPSRLSRDEKIAFWINAYNILTIDLILKHHPIAGIKDIGSFFSPVWDIEVVTIEGKPRSLGAIEHEILRKMGEPRIHAAIVCASTSCPPLSRTPFRPDALDADLTAAMQTWLASKTKGIHIDRAHKRVTISKIFDWFAEDFDAKGGALAVISKYIPAKDGDWLRKNKATVSVGYFDYDWSLNGVRR